MRRSLQYVLKSGIINLPGFQVSWGAGPSIVSRKSDPARYNLGQKKDRCYVDSRLLLQRRQLFGHGPTKDAGAQTRGCYPNMKLKSV